MGMLDRLFSKVLKDSPSTQLLIPLPSADGVDRGDLVTRTVIEWLMAELPADGRDPDNWPTGLGLLRFGPQADKATRALAAAQNLLEKYGSLIRDLRGPKKQLIELWALSTGGRICALFEERPPAPDSCYLLWLLQNSRRGVTLLFAPEFDNLPPDYHTR